MMGQPIDTSTEHLGLLANGSAGRWDVAVDESLDRENELSLEIEGPHVYLVFQLRDLSVVSEALKFLQERLRRDWKSEPTAEGGDALVLGKFAAAAVTLVWDNETFPRCFLLIGQRARSTFRLSIEGDEIRKLAEALEQTVSDLPQNRPE